MLMFREEGRDGACLQDHDGKWAPAGCRVKVIQTLCSHALPAHGPALLMLLIHYSGPN